MMRGEQSKEEESCSILSMIFFQLPYCDRKEEKLVYATARIYSMAHNLA